MTAAEKWRGIDGYPDYEVSDEGRIRRVTSRTFAKAGRILSTRGLRSGYPSLDLCRNGDRRTFSVHRLVAAAFLGPCPAGYEVNHRNGDKTDNRVHNLEYATSSGNQRHAYQSGLQEASGEKNGFAKLTEAQVREIRILLEPRTRSYSAIGRDFGVSEGTIRAIASGRTWSHVK